MATVWHYARMGILLRLAASAVALWVATLLISGIRLTTDSVIGPRYRPQIAARAAESGGPTGMM